MAKITNHTRGTLDFITGVKDGAAVTDHVDGGETKDISLMDPNDATVLGRVASGAISIESAESSADKRKSAIEKRSASPASGE